MILWRSAASRTGGEIIVVPGATDWGSAMRRSSVASSQLIPTRVRTLYALNTRNRTFAVSLLSEA
jgi:hypothetical protein